MNRGDRWLIVLPLLLTALGVIMVYSSSAILGITRYQDPNYFLARQFVRAGLGVLVLLLCATLVDLKRLERAAPVLFGAGLALLVAVSALGHVSNGATRWLRIGFLSVQPTDVGRLATVMFLAWWLKRNPPAESGFVRGLLPPLGFVGAAAGLILLQPNLCLRPAFPRPLPPDGSAFADWFYLPEGSALYRVPDTMSDRVAVLTEPLAAALRAFERSFLPGDPERSHGTGPGCSLAVLGSGPVGALVAALGSMAGCEPVIVVGGPASRLDLCRALGATTVLDIAALDRPSRIEEVRRATPHRLGADAVVEAAGVPEALADGIEMCRPGGTLVEVGHYTDRGTVTINPLMLCRKDINLFGCWGYGPRQFGHALRVLGAHGGLLGRLVTHTFPLDDIVEALETARRQECMKAVVEMA